mgnify:CR=1 FL=1
MQPSDIPIAGNCRNIIGKAIGGVNYRIGRFKINNAFLVIKDEARFLYVRPRYSWYRTVANSVFSSVTWKVDFDHALAKRIALKSSPEYKYVLLLRVPPSVNRKHGSFEKKDQLNGTSPELCYADDRILDKWLGRAPKARQRGQEVMDGYSIKNITKNGLTLKQRGKCAYAIGIGDSEF